MGLFEREQSIIAEALSKSSDKEALQKLVNDQRLETGTRRFASDADAQKALQAEEAMAKGHEARLEKASQASALMNQIKTGIQNGTINSRQDILNLLNKVSATHSKYSSFAQVPDQSDKSRSEYMLAKAADVLIKELGGIGKIPFHPKESIPGIKQDELMNEKVESLISEIEAAKASGEITDIDSLNRWLTDAKSPLEDSAIQAIETTYLKEGDISKHSEQDVQRFLRARAAKLLLERVDYFQSKSGMAASLNRNPFEGNPNKEDELQHVLNNLKSSANGNVIDVEGLPEGEDLSQISAELSKRTDAYHAKETELIENDKSGRLKNGVYSAIRFLAGFAPTEALKTEKGAITANSTAATKEAEKNSAEAAKTAKSGSSSTTSVTANPTANLSSRAQILATLDIAHLKPKFKSMTCYYSLDGHNYSQTFKGNDFINPSKLKEISSWLKKKNGYGANMEFTDKDGKSYSVTWTGSNGRFVYSDKTPDDEKLPLSPSEKLLKESQDVYGSDKKKSFAIALEAVQANPSNISALVLVANKYRLGDGVKENSAQALKFYRKALEVSPEQADSALRVATILLDNKDKTLGHVIEAYNLLKVASESKNGSIKSEAESYISEHYDSDKIYEWGIAKEKEDITYSIKCYELALKINPDHGASSLRLGELYLHGKGVRKDLDKAKMLLETAYNSLDSKISEKAQNLIDKFIPEKKEEN